MQVSKLNEWVNVGAAISVLAGLLRVAYELRQNNELAKAETVRALWELDSELRQLELQSDILPLLRTSVDEPSSLTDEEIDRLDTYLALAMQNQLSVATMRDTYGLAAAEATIEVQAADIVDSFFLSRFGRGWFAANVYWTAIWHPDLVEAIKQQLAQEPVATKYSWPDEIRSSDRRSS